MRAGAAGAAAVPLAAAAVPLAAAAVPLAAAAVPLAAAALHAAPAATARDPLRRLWPRLAGQGAPRGVALTFDDGPDPEGTPAVLSALAEQGWTATFFLLGSQTRRHPDVARAVAAAGHEIALHGDDHRNHLFRGPGWVDRDLSRASATITEVTGARPRLFRPPYGVLSGGSLRTAARLRLRPVLWTAWGRDWLPSTPGQVVDSLLAGVRPGGTLLLHDSDCTGSPRSWRATAGALPLLAAELDRRGLAVRPLRDHLVSTG